MATWTGEETTQAVLAQAEIWKQKCLLGNESVFSNESLWTVENFGDLKVLFVDNPILGNQKFYEKLALQLDSAKPEVIKLAAEALWLLLLFVGDNYFGASTKISRIREIWELSGEDFSETPVLAADALAGVANPGTAFLTMIFAEFGFLVELLLDFKKLPEERRTALLDDEPWDLCEWTTGREGGTVRAFRHMFLFFCYPSNFERICSKNHKKQVYDVFSDRIESADDQFRITPSSCNLDRSILSIRRALELEFGTHKIDFYSDHVKPLWQKSKAIKKTSEIERGSASPSAAMPRISSSSALNTIFYGPPGTGKTYVTARRAVEICDGSFTGSDQELRVRYDQLVKQRRIEFVTFHQSYGYEEFVEGLRPDTSGSEDGEIGPGFRLQDRPGVLKRIAERARKLPSGSRHDFDPTGRQVYKVSLGRNSDPQDDYLREECLNGAYILLGYGGDVDWSSDQYASWQSIADKWRSLPGQQDTDSRHGSIVFTAHLRVGMRVGDIVLASRGTRMIQAIGVVAGPYEFVKREIDDYHHRRRVEWIWKDEDGEGIPVSDVYEKNFMQHPIYWIDPKRVNWDALLPYVATGSHLGEPPPPHVLIIDEINRANISKVMGELITLLEEDKRAGAPNEIAVTLPHSGEQFTLPANLHIIGTMNTADRSIALLDTALRRRFQFEEMPPKSSVLDHVDDVDVALVLERLNSRLEWFLGSDQLIGHAWFMKAKTLPELDAVIAKKIIPLLREYFHEDVNRVRAVLGGGDGFLKREKIPTPPGIDGYGDDRYRFVDQYSVKGAYGQAAYQEAVGGVASDDAE